MKKAVLLCVLMLSASVFFAGGSYADMDIEYLPGIEVPEKWNVGVTSSIVFPNDSAIDNGFNVEALISKDYNKNVAFGLEFGYTTYEVDALGVEWGRVHSFPILVDVIFKLPFEVNEFIVVPYIVNGLGCMINNADESDSVADVNGSFDADHTFLYKLGGGIDWYVNESVGFTFETSYRWATSDWTVTRGTGGAAEKDIDVNAFYLGGGLKFKF